MRTNGSKPNQRILIQGGMVYDHDADQARPRTADVVISGGRIESVTPVPDTKAPPPVEGSFDRVIAASGKLLLPGFFNAHYHGHDTLLKGCFETPPLDLWALLAMPHAYGRRSREELRLRTLVGAMECLRSGITTVQDMHGVNPFEEEDLDVILSAYEEVGIRCVFAPQFGNKGRMSARVFYPEVIGEADRWRLSARAGQFPAGTDIAARVGDYVRSRRGRSSLVSFALAPVSPEACTQALWEAVGELAEREDLPIYTHLYENKGMTHIARELCPDTRGSLVHWLSSLGVLGPRLSMAHSVWLRRDEIDEIAGKRAHVVLNPVGNLKTRSGIAASRTLLEAGVNVAIGCDNCSCSDAQNMFQVMKMFVLLAGVCEPDEGRPYATDALRAATVNGAAAAGLHDLGHLRAGMRADLSILDLDDISYVPLNNVARQVVYTEAGRAVDTVLVDGRIVIDNRRFTTVDEDAVRRTARELMPALLRDLDEVKARLEPLAPAFEEAQRRTWNTDIGVFRFVPPLPDREGGAP